jgi:cation:H+ antiporter
LTAGLSGRDGIAVANVLGSNVFNLGIILGGCALIRALETTRESVMRDGLLLVSVAALLTVMLTDGRLSRLEGLVLLSALGTYLFVLWRSHAAGAVANPDELAHLETGRGIPATLVFLVLGLGAICAGGPLLVEGASGLARAAGLSEWLIGITVVAAGTSAPELATSLAAVARHRPGMLVGNLLGSDLMNILGVLGISSLVSPLRAPEAAGLPSLLFLATCVLTVVFLRTELRLVRWEGGLLIVIALVRWAESSLG